MTSLALFAAAVLAGSALWPPGAADLRDWPRAGDRSAGIVLAAKKPGDPPQAPAAKPNRPPEPPGAVPPPVAVPGSPLAPERPPERLELDVSTPTVAITSGFAGTEIIVFGTVLNSRQESAELAYYDVVVVVDGEPAPAVVRRKANVGGVWVNTQALRFDGLPPYSAISSTRPVDEIADAAVLAISGIGFGRARMYPGRGSSGLSPAEIDAYKSAVIRLKERDRLYVTDPFGVAFVGRSLFRATIRLPANIPIGPLSTRAFLFREGRLLATHAVSVKLERQGLERLIYDFAFEHPVGYGVLAVAIAMSAGLAGSALFRRRAR
jgi:uncharacterized protein (TIGR02186 family)